MEKSDLRVGTRQTWRTRCCSVQRGKSSARLFWASNYLCCENDALRVHRPLRHGPNRVDKKLRHFFSCVCVSLEGRLQHLRHGAPARRCRRKCVPVVCASLRLRHNSYQARRFTMETEEAGQPKRVKRANIGGQRPNEALGLTGHLADIGLPKEYFLDFRRTSLQHRQPGLQSRLHMCMACI